MLAIVCVAVICVSMLAACDNKEPTATDDSTYTIQYTDESGTHKVEVKNGEAFTFDRVPSKTGYEFVGLFDAKVGGTQYTDNFGASLSAFTDKKNVVLYPQFKPNEYTVILDYQGAQVTGSRQFTVEYDSSLPELPKNVVLEHKVFVGWYTKPNCEGVQVADGYGLVPRVSIINEQNFNLTEKYIYLYAGFSAEKFSVTFCFKEGMNTEVVQADYGTPISQIVPKTRVDGKAPLSWSKTKDGEVFNGTITDDIVLYAVEYAPIIDFDANGGSDVASLVARANSEIQLPTPTKADYAFAGWHTVGGVKFDSTTMPQDSIQLIAKWNPMIVFDERGGEDVNDISGQYGSTVTLPQTSKDGYVFAGWYTEQGDVYTSTTMPKTSVKLIAKYYKVCKKTIVQIAENSTKESSIVTPTLDYYVDKTTFVYPYIKLDLGDIYQLGVRSVKLTIHYSAKSKNGQSATMYWYSQNQASDAYKVWQYTDPVVEAWSSFEHTTEMDISNGTLYAALCSGKYLEYVKWTNMWFEIEYPDTSQLF